MVAVLRRHPLVLPVLLLAVVVATWAWRADADESAPSSIITIDPVRILDTRDGTDLGLAGPLTNGTSQQLQVTGAITTSSGDQTVVPPGATGVLLNVTATRPTAAGFLSVRPGSATGDPETSSLNFAAGQTVPNAVTVALPTSDPALGSVDLFHGGGTAGSTVDVIVDVVGYIAATEEAPAVQLVSADQSDDVTLDDLDANVVVVTLSFDAPAAGQLLLTGSATLSDMEEDAFLTCGISDDGTNPSTATWESAGPAGSIGQISTTLLVDVTAGTSTFQLLCTSLRADDGQPAFASAGRLAAVYTPS